MNIKFITLEMEILMAIFPKYPFTDNLEDKLSRMISNKIADEEVCLEADDWEIKEIINALTIIRDIRYSKNDIDEFINRLSKIVYPTKN